MTSHLPYERLNKILVGDARQLLKGLPDNSVDCCVTSPPYYGLRDYGTSVWIDGDENCNHRRDTKNANPDWEIQSRGKVDNGVGDEIFKGHCKKCGAKRIDFQIGLEETPEQYVETMVQVFAEVKRILKKQGTLWLNLGDSYWGSGGTSGQSLEHTNLGKLKSERLYAAEGITQKIKSTIYKPKDLIGIPWMVAFALRSSGYYLRQDNIWHKKTCMPESVQDRCTKSHEYIFLLSKSHKYYFDYESIMEPIASSTFNDARLYNENYIAPFVENGYPGAKTKGNGLLSNSSDKFLRNKRSVWSVAPAQFPEAHFATFPEDIIVDCIKAGCPENGIVLDPFMGAGTTGLVARKLHRNFIGIELNPAYVKLAENRLQKELGLFI